MRFIRIVLEIIALGAFICWALEHARTIIVKLIIEAGDFIYAVRCALKKAWEKAVAKTLKKESNKVCRSIKKESKTRI